LTVTDVDSAAIELYWMPGCSSCLRAKEFIEKAGIRYEAINASEDHERAKKLRRHGLQLPAVCVGDRCVNAGSLPAIAELLDIDYDPPVILPPSVLKDRYIGFVDAFQSYLRQMPPDGLAHKLPNRDRPMFEVAHQCAAIMRAFLKAYYENEHDIAVYDDATGVTTAADLERKSDETLSMFLEWWERDGQHDPLDRIVPNYWGYPTLHELLEREVWHTAHHVRQLMHVLTELGVPVQRPLEEDELAGLPLPARVHE
jgi:glutaredoxin